MDNNTATRPGHTVMYWKVEEITTANHANIPGWVLNGLSNKDIVIGSTFDIDTFTNKFTLSYKTIAGYKDCSLGDYLLNDSNELYALSEVEFKSLYNIEGDSIDK